MSAEHYWTRAERAEWRGASAPDGHLPEIRRVAYLKVRPEDMRRILATVDALEDTSRRSLPALQHLMHYMSGEQALIECGQLIEDIGGLLAALEGK